MSSNQLTTINNFCEITATSLAFKRDVSKIEWQKVFDACRHIEGCIQFWIGDLLKYREQRWGMYDDIVDETGIDKESLRHYKDVADKIESGNRLPDLGYTHHLHVAYLEPEKQKQVLQKALKNNWTVRETREAVKAIKRGDDKRKQTELPQGIYNLIYADPPWQYNDKQETEKLGGAEKHYPLMSIQELCEMEIPKTTKNAALFLWVTSPILEESFEVINSWGFEYKTSFIWDKVKHNMGHYNSVRHELLLICVKGSYTPENKKLFDSVQVIEKTIKHSEKPDEFGKIINTLYPSSKKIELFCREKRSYHDKTWSIWGNEID